MIGLVLVGCKAYSDEDKANIDKKIVQYEKKNNLQLEQSPSGLHYKVFKSEEGRAVKSNDMITVTYAGKQLNGSEFDRQDTPIELNVKEMIPAWREVLAEMSIGDSCVLIAPPFIAYGRNGKGEIPGNAILFFTMKVHDAY